MRTMSLNRYADRTTFFDGLTCLSVIYSPRVKLTYVGKATDIRFIAEDSVSPYLRDAENDRELMERICQPVYDEYPGEW